ncbi:GNAT family N-acetyltransferase [Paenibacillus gansuensis]|uniref:GNAT family N-acetyltransferase n=1 Tax=Paenibacillus gansuensis TaxID=306542 RepID=A0ABW5PHU9_9BACL
MGDYSFRLKYSPWDSAVLGVEAYQLSFNRALAPKGEENMLIKQRLLEIIHKTSVQFISCRLASAEIKLIQELESVGFYTVDQLLTFTYRLGQESPQFTKGSGVKEASKTDAPFIREMHHQFVQGRFYNDPRISKETAHKVYKKWIEDTLEGKRADQMFVHESMDGKVTGFISCILSQDTERRPYGIIDLIAVSSGYQGQGIGRQLLETAVLYFRSHGTSHVQVGTQSSNSAALSLYQNNGFRLHSAETSLHYWNPLLPK